MLLSSVPVGETSQVKAIWGGEKIKEMLEDVGITLESEISVVFKAWDDALVVGVDGRRVIMDQELAGKITV
ncbi:MAG: FeoA family protein [Christensenellales bacterium]|jgi:Fe2+ transport system protein FeoA